MRVSQCIYDHLCVDTCAIAIYLVGKVVEYVEEYHKVTGNPKMIWKPSQMVRRELY